MNGDWKPAFGQCTTSLSWQHKYIFSLKKHHDLHSQNGWKKKQNKKIRQKKNLITNCTETKEEEKKN